MLWNRKRCVQFRCSISVCPLNSVKGETQSEFNIPYHLAKRTLSTKTKILKYFIFEANQFLLAELLILLLNKILYGITSVDS